MTSGDNEPNSTNKANHYLFAGVGACGVVPRARPMTKSAGAYAAEPGGLDAFVFTAGIGENFASLRATLCKKLSGLGIVLDPVANARNAERIYTAESRVSVWVIPTNES